MYSLLGVLWASASASMGILTVLCIGAVISLRTTILDEPTMDKLGKLVMDYLLPCLLITEVGGIVASSDVLTLWPIPAFSFGIVFANALISFLAAKILCCTPDQTRFLVACCTFGNATSVPLAFVGAVFPMAPGLFQLSVREITASTVSRGEAFVLLYTVFETLFRWSFGLKLLQHSELPPTSNSTLKSESTPLVAPESYREPVSSHLKSPGALRRLLELGKGVFSYLPAPVFFCIVSLIVGLTPIRDLFFQSKISIFYPNPPLRWVISATKTVGVCFAPVSLLMLGSNIVHAAKHESASLPPKLLGAIFVIRLLVLPTFVGLFLIYYLFHTKLGVVTDPAMLFVLLIQTITPPAISLGVMCAVQHFMLEEMARTLFVLYSLGMATMPIFLFAVLALMTLQ